MNEYRTNAQFDDIMENMLNGNWQDAASGCVDGGFYANDLLIAFERDFADIDDTSGYLKDLILLAELAAEKRSK